MGRTAEQRIARLEALEADRAALDQSQHAVLIYPAGDAPTEVPDGFFVLLPDNGRGDRQAAPKPARS